MAKMISIAVLVLSCFLQNYTSAYKILGVFPITSRSHYIAGSALMRGLAARGHEVSAITAFPGNEQIENFEEIPIPEILEHFKDLYSSLQKTGDKFILEIYHEMVYTGRKLSALVLEHPIIQNLLTNPNRTFDLVICEIFVADALYGFGQHFNAPIIGFSPMGNSFWSSVITGSPMPPSYVPNIFLSNRDRMNFAERALNLAVLTIQYLGYNFHWLPYQAEVYDKFFPNASVSLPEVLRNFSLVLINSHFSIGSPEPHFPNTISVGGFHIDRQLKPLPSDIKEFLDNATDGAIYFSLGSNFKSECLGKDKQEAFLRTFSSLKQRVLWKYENSSLPGKSENVLFREWFPQSEVLAHPNVKLFITHGGMLGIIESLYHGKPVLGIPMICDQFLNIARAVEAGYCLKVSTGQISDEKLKGTIVELLSNPKYTTKAKEISTRLRDQPMEPLDTAIFWVEYVLRHKGARHLRTIALDLNLFQYHSLDTIAVVYGGVLLILGLLLKLLKSYLFKVLRLNKVGKVKQQ